MALPVLMGVMIGSQLLSAGVSLFQQHQMNKQNEKALAMMQGYQQQQNQMLAQFMGGQGQGYPGLQQQRA